MKKRALKIRLSISGILMVIALITTHSYISLAALLAAAMHELGHVLTAHLLNIPLREMKLGIFGASLSLSDSFLSYKKEIILAAAGPLTNIACVLLSIFLFDIQNDFFELFISSSLFLGILNLLPILDFDGGRILLCLLSLKISPDVALRILKISSFILIFTLWALSVYLLLKLSSSLSLFIFSISLFAKLFISK